jgi:hypothetical protein
MLVSGAGAESWGACGGGGLRMCGGGDLCPVARNRNGGVDERVQRKEKEEQKNPK